jgi:hypothetical protein
MPVRGCFLFASPAANVVAFGEAADTLRDGSVPGKGLRTGNSVSFQMGAGFSSSPGLPRAR